MRRYWALSIFLHALVFAGFFYRQVDPIDEPIVAVSLDLNQPSRAGAPRPPRVTPVTKVSPPQMKAVDPDLPDRSSADLNSDDTSTTPSSAYEAGNVSVKPRVMKQIQIVYPQQAKEARIEGAVRLSVVINEVGHVEDVTVLEGPGYGLNEAAQAALKQFIFSPAEVEGQKVPVRIVYVYRFKLESR